MIKNIILDFDGVILESNSVKIAGFYELFKEFGEEKAYFISSYFGSNAGLSRYDIIKFFFKTYNNEEIDEDKLLYYANKYSEIVKTKVVLSDFVPGCKEFIENNIDYNLYIVSSSDEKDLKFICNKIEISSYFDAILGSPVKKEINIKNILNYYKLDKNETIYIGDSLNDYHATIKNKLTFIGRNSGVYDFNKIEDIIVIKDLKNLTKIVRTKQC